MDRYVKLRHSVLLPTDSDILKDVTLTVSTAATLCADLTWYLLGRWRGSRVLDLLTRLVPKVRTHVQCASHLLFAHERVFRLGARFLPVVNPIAAGLAGAAGMSVSRFLPGAAVSAAVWAGSWIGIGYLLTHGGAGLARSFGIPLTFVVIAILVGWRLLRQAQRRHLLHTLRRARMRAGLGSRAEYRPQEMGTLKAFMFGRNGEPKDVPVATSPLKIMKQDGSHR